MMSEVVVQGNSEERMRTLWHLLFRLALIGFAAFFFWRVRTIASLVVAALVLASFVDAIVTPLCRHRLGRLRPHTQRVLLTTVVFVLLLVGLFWTGRMLLHPFQNEYRNLQQNWGTYQDALMQKFSRAKDWYAALPEDIRNYIADQSAGQSSSAPSEWLSRFLGNTFHWAANLLELLLVPILAFYFVVDSRRLRNQFLFLVPRHWHRPCLAILGESGNIMRAYIGAQLWLAVIAAVIVGAGLKLIGMDYAVILGLLAGATRIIPIIGGFLGGIPIVLLAFVYGAEHHNPLLWVWVALFISALNVFEGKFLMPKFLSHHLDVHPVIIIVALLVGGEFFGLMGMFLAAPVAALGRILLIHYVMRRRRAAQPQLVITTHEGSVLRLERAIRSTTIGVGNGSLNRGVFNNGNHTESSHSRDITTITTTTNPTVGQTITLPNQEQGVS